MNTPSRMSRPPSLSEREARLSTPLAENFIHTGAAVVTSSEDVADNKPEDVQVHPAQSAEPWEGKSTQHTKQKPFRMLEDEAEMLKFLGDTTYNQTAQSIFEEAIRIEMVKRFRERGYTVSQDPKTGKLRVTSGKRTRK